ncbi:MarR family winged helix-turn-helix transcriptional regulator [Cellulomonas sp. KRMCY2]|uniref:MarR family winged helix-turn-helix transcriptional regulator n=1 Tax=Cellulomonas sp. KRMCY2 TaxID=1304865 RepID=UPI00045EAD64|nr:MarR family transcriptional regulator [Cellulomonas sp. KRMCY2]
MAVSPVAPAALTSVTASPSAAACRPASLAGDLRVALTRATRRLRFERSSERITDGQYAVLAALSNRGPMTPTALAEDQHVQPPPMTRTINVLATAGLVRRDEHPTDRRQVIVSVTEAGLAEVRETRRRRNEWLAKRLAGLEPAEREVLARAAVLLERIASQ